ncbi:MAG: hypothetical protein KDI34_20705 [Halioglobus sp.]|nr:hypothetical protein [Halioglobus sp.]
MKVTHSLSEDQPKSTVTGFSEALIVFLNSDHHAEVEVTFNQFTRFPGGASVLPGDQDFPARA